MNSFFPGLPMGQARVAVLKRGHRGQTLVLALAILFLLVILGSIFVTTLLRNLTRVTRQGRTDEALTLAMAGLQFASHQFKTSVEGADWRPTPTEPLWRYPIPGSDPPQRALDPDYEWLSDNGAYARPFVRYGTGRGRFLLRVTFEPTLEAQDATGTGSQFQQNSGMIHIESIGRPGEFDPNDPSFLTDPTLGGEDRNNNGALDPGEDTNGNGRLDGFRNVGQFRKVEAYVPVGLLDQLWWVTNHTNEPGPATFGVPMLQNAGFDNRYPESVTNQRAMEYPAVYQGAIRSNTDLEFYGRNVIRFYPARGEGVFVKGEIRLAPRGSLPNPSSIQLQIDAMDDDGNNRAPTMAGGVPVIDSNNDDDDPTNDSVLASISQTESANAGFNPLPLQTPGRQTQWGVLDEAHMRKSTTAPDGGPVNRSIRVISAPLLNQEDPSTGISRWRMLTRDSGGQIQIGTRTFNTGAFGLTDRYQAARVPSANSLDPDALVDPVSATLRAKGLYIDNFDDVQYPKNRPRVKDEWLQRMPTPSWAGDTYTPTIDKTQDHPDRKTPTPIVDILLTSRRVPDPSSAGGDMLVPALVVTRFDPDVRQTNQPAGSGSDPRLFYNLVGNDLVPVGQTRIFDYPENGVVFAEGSIRVRGVSGVGGMEPQPLTIVSGGTIYIEGNLLQLRSGQSQASGWQISLLAQDNVVLNPSAFTRVTLPHGNVAPPAGDPDDPTVDGFYRIQPGSELDFIFTTASLADSANNPLERWLVHVKHAGGDRTDATSETRVTLNLPSLLTNWPQAGDQYDFSGNPPPPATPVYAPANQNFYLFHEISPGATVTWGESSWRYPDREQKTFFVPLAGRLLQGLDNTFRIQNALTTSANDKDYLFGKVAVLPENGPLPIRIEAVMYAFTGSWFVIPPPFFNDHLDAAKQPDPYDSRAYFAQNNGVREDPATYPINTDHYPFYREPLNMDIEVVGSITENMPADPGERARWTNHLWLQDPVYDPSAFPPETRPAFSPNIRYRYDGDLRRLVRVRNLRTGKERVAWASPIGTRQGGIPSVQSVINQWLADPTTPSYSVTLPLIPKLPASATFYEGNPL